MVTNAEQDKLLHLQFDQQATNTPDRIALYWKEQSITYAELKVGADRVAGALRERDLCDGATIGLHIERSIDFVVAMLGVLKANNAVLPIPPSYPAERVKEMLDYSAVDAVVDDTKSPLNPAASDRIIHFSQLRRHLGERREMPAGTDVQPAFVLSTSGSTGEPKMIVRSHRSFFHRFTWTWNNHPYSDGELCVQKSHMTTTHAIYELFEPLLRGVPVIIIPDDEARNLEQFWETIRSRSVTRLLIVPSALQVSLDMPGFVAPKLHMLVLMGEYVNRKLAERAISSLHPDTKLFTIYGSTEASSTLVCNIRESFRASEELPLGTPISTDTTVSILTEDLQEITPNDSAGGVLHIGGPALFSEYFRNVALTGSAFVRIPGRSGPMYNTRDHVRMRPDGSLQFVSRIDQTVKVRGYRVDLQEVENTLLQHPGMKQVTVAATERDSEGAQLVAFYSPPAQDTASLYDTLRKSLPHYMIPSAMIGLDSLPLTASGKIDRQRLVKEHAANSAAPVSATVAKAETIATTETESRVFDAWQKVLGHSAFQRDSNFFEVGGTSLTVFALVHHLRVASGLSKSDLTAESVYSFPAFAQLATHIDALRSGTQSDAAVNSILVTLKKADDPSLGALFVIASAGGTLGAYTKLAKVLTTPRAMIGVRDPFNWGDRDPTMGFQKWVEIYLAGIRSHQAHGPYYLCAYSSGAALAIEMAQQLKREGEQVALLTLIDPVGVGGKIKEDIGYYAFDAMFRGTPYKMLVRMMGKVLKAGHKLGVVKPPRTINNFSIDVNHFQQRARESTQSKDSVMLFSALLELNTGLPFTLSETDFAAGERNEVLDVLIAKVRSVAPEIDDETMRNVFLQYNCLQVRSQHNYRMQDYDGTVHLFEPAGGHVGLLAAQFGIPVKDLRTTTFDLGPPSDRTRLASEKITWALRPHYVCIRDDKFVASLARALDALLK